MWKRLRPSTNIYLDLQLAKDKSFLSYTRLQSRYAPEKSRKQSQQGKLQSLTDFMKRVKEKSVMKQSKSTTKQKPQNKSILKQNQSQDYSIKITQYSISPDKRVNFSMQSPHKKTPHKSKNEKLEKVIKKLKEVNKTLRQTVNMLLEQFKNLVQKQLQKIVLQQFENFFHKQLQKMMKNTVFPEGFPDTSLSSITYIPENFVANTQKNNFMHLHRLSTIQTALKDFEEDNKKSSIVQNIYQIKMNDSHKEEIPKRIMPDKSNCDQQYNIHFKSNRSSSQNAFQKIQTLNHQQEQPQQSRKRSSSRHSSIKQTTPAKQVMLHFNQTLNQMKKLMKAQLNKA